MTEEEFSELSVRVLQGEAAESERARHGQVCSNDPDLAETFEEIKVALGLLKDKAPLAAAMDADEPKIPESLREELLDEVRTPGSTQDESLSENHVFQGASEKLFMPARNVPLEEHQAHARPRMDSKPPENNLRFLILSLAAAAAVVLFFVFKGNESPTNPSGTPGEQPPMLASVDVEFGHWKDDIVRGENPEDDWLPQWVKTVPLENNDDLKTWKEKSAKLIRVWINDDEAQLMILRPGQQEPEVTALVFKPDEQKQQIIKLLEDLRSPK